MTAEELRLSEVRYIDYETDLMPDGNTFFPIIHKQKAYSYENEIRLIHEKRDWSKEEIEDGIFIKIDIDILISEIIIGPFSPRWFLDLIKDICIKYDLKKNITRSKLS